MIDVFSFQLTLLVLFLILLALFFSYSKYIFRYAIHLAHKISSPLVLKIDNRVVKWVGIVVFIFSSLIMCLDRGLINVSYTLISSLNIDDNNFKAQLNKLGMNDYVFPYELEVSSKRKNIIIISLESFEKAYLSDKLSHTTPFLRSLKSNVDWDYYNMNQNEGSKWTSGSLYSSLTGFPAYFGTQHNKIFQSSYHSNITSIGHILKKVGYKTTYIVSDAEFSGTQEMLYANKINDIIDKTILEGRVADKDLFERAKHEVLENNIQDIPFVLFISTVSTHPPNGIYDKRMEQYVLPQKTNLEFMASAVDYMLKDFINYLQEIDILSNTIIYIFPDHLKMGDNRLFKGTGERGLYILTNALNDDISYDENDTLYQIDLPKFILEGSGVKHNAKFLTDYIQGDKNRFIKDNIHGLTALNIAGFSRTQLNPYIVPKISEYYEEYKDDSNRYIAHAGGMIDGNFYTNSLEALDESYDKGFKFFELDIQKSSDGKYVAAHDWQEWAQITDCKNSTPVTHQEFLKHKIYGKYTPLDMDRINAWFNNHKDAVLVTDKINEPKQFSDLFIDKKRLMMELFSWDAVKLGVEANIKSSMPTESLIELLKGNEINKLKNLGVSGVTFSRKSIASNMELLLEMKKNNIHVYVYNVNSDIDRGEEYVVKYEMDFVYGIYADKWNFESEK
jgi:hypothetical protein